MANRDELMIIRSARVGQATAQLALGKRYLFGGGGLPQSLATALHWLERAAEQNQQDAWLLIGNHIPFDIAHQAANPLRIALWYERAYEAGVAKAGLTLAMLVFAHWPRADHSLRQKATGALQMAAESGLPEAQWLLAQQLGIKDMINQIAARLQPPERPGVAYSMLSVSSPMVPGSTKITSNIFSGPCPWRKTLNVKARPRAQAVAALTTRKTSIFWRAARSPCCSLPTRIAG